MEEQRVSNPRWTIWAGVAVVIGCIVTILATLNDIF